MTTIMLALAGEAPFDRSRSTCHVPEKSGRRCAARTVTAQSSTATRFATCLGMIDDQRIAETPIESGLMAITRRRFVSSASRAVVGFAAAPSLLVRQRVPYELVIRGCTVFDGTGAPGVVGDLAIAGGKIVALARHLSEMRTAEIDARGLAVAPGFIDIHSHGDGSISQDPRVESLIRQGITTIVVGQDGSSRNAA